MAIRTIAPSTILGKAWLTQATFDGSQGRRLYVGSCPHSIQHVSSPRPLGGDHPAVVVEYVGDDRVQCRQAVQSLPLQGLAYVDLRRDCVEGLHAQLQKLRDLPRLEKVGERQGYVHGLGRELGDRPCD